MKTFSDDLETPTIDIVVVEMTYVVLSTSSFS